MAGILTISLIGVGIWLSLQKEGIEIFILDDNLVVRKYSITLNLPPLSRPRNGIFKMDY
jgi:hypothetical protein